MAERPGDSVPLARVGDLLERVLGIYAEDWQVTDYDQEFEGWSGALKSTCICDPRSCVCSDPRNLTDEDITLIRAAMAALAGRTADSAFPKQEN